MLRFSFFVIHCSYPIAFNYLILFDFIASYRRKVSIHLRWRWLEIDFYRFLESMHCTVYTIHSARKWKIRQKKKCFNMEKKFQRMRISGRLLSYTTHINEKASKTKTLKKINVTMSININFLVWVWGGDKYCSATNFTSETVSIMKTHSNIFDSQNKA